MSGRRFIGPLYGSKNAKKGCALLGRKGFYRLSHAARELRRQNLFHVGLRLEKISKSQIFTLLLPIRRLLPPIERKDVGIARVTVRTTRDCRHGAWGSTRQ